MFKNKGEKLMASSRIPGFYKLSIPERLKTLHKKNVISIEDYTILKNGKSFLRPEDSDKMVENVIGVFGLPLGLGLNMLVNNKDYVVPMAVEEPSIIAAISSAAKVVRKAGGFTSESAESILIGQIQVVDVKDTTKAKIAILQNKEDIINLANSLHPNMVARGGGVKDIEVRILPAASRSRGDMVIVHLLVDSCDAMGANLVNSMCECVAPLIEKITLGSVFLRILSNLADRSLVRANCTIPPSMLEVKEYCGEKVRDAIILAYEFAAHDPYRAATHNKGILNGIDPVVIATGNDWRAIEAAAHAYAGRGQKYTSLTKWSKNKEGHLVGNIEIPIRIGTVGGPLESNPIVPIVHRILNIKSARELAEVLGAVGLAQNMSALRALATEGIQRGHMSLHARSVAAAAGAKPEIFETVVEKLIHSGETKVWKAKEIIKSIKEPKDQTPAGMFLKPALENIPTGFGKIILLGEHAVLYGSHALAAPIPLAMQAKVSEGKKGIDLMIPRWGVEEHIQKNVEHKYSIYKSLEMILDKFDLYDRNMKIEVFPHVPRAMGLGGSGALAVAIIRALSEYFELKLSDEEICNLAYESEKIVHGNASGIDNTMATYGKFLLFRKGDPPKMKEIKVNKSIRMVIALTYVESLTATMVSKLRKAWEKNKQLYNRIFDEINDLTLKAVEAVKKYDMELLGELMNINQGLLNALQVSGREIEEIIDIARSNGAIGAKLTGGGGGGAVIALCPEDAEKVVKAITRAGYKAFIVDINGNH
jgi:hydroxymethylglutaryl-CoA reductase